MSLILPGPQPPKGGLSILVPRGYDERPAVGECYMCGLQFAAGDNVMAHLRSCVKDAGHDHRMAEEERKEAMHIFSEEAWDPEVAAHLREVGKRMLREGRLETKPNERAGFS